MDQPLPQGKVLVDIQEIDRWRAAVNSAYYCQHILDLQDGYRAQGDLKPSVLTNVLEKVLGEMLLKMQEAADVPPVETAEEEAEPSG